MKNELALILKGQESRRHGNHHSARGPPQGPRSLKTGLQFMKINLCVYYQNYFKHWNV